MSQTPSYLPLRAPSEDRGLLIRPPLADAAALVEANRGAIAASDGVEVGGCTLRCLRQSGRAEMLDAAYAYTKQYRDVLPPVIARPSATHQERTTCEPGTAGRTAPVILSGHQPEMFHPGVWCKNFVLDRHRAALHANVVHLLVDSDTIKSSTLSVPAGSVAEPHLERVAFDEPREEIPWEERTIADASTLRSFGERCRRQLAPFVADPLVASFWPRAIEHCLRENNLGRGISAARHAIEGSWGLSTLEVPVSRLCGTRSFCTFAFAMLEGAERFATIYNQALEDYRHANRIRSANHPVPRLEIAGNVCEVPFWLWRSQAPRRRRAFVERLGNTLRLTDRDQISIELPTSGDGAASREGAIEILRGLADQGIKLRSRALVTTMAARLIFSDLFLHGIGGAKYDQLTDAIASRFFGFPLPEFQTVSATLRLPIPHPHSAEQQWRSARAELRDLAWHPEKHLADASLRGEGPSSEAAGFSLVGDGQSSELRPTADAHRLAEEKARWIAAEVDESNARQRFEAIRGLTAELQPFVDRNRADAERRRVAGESGMLAERILDSREYAFVLYPEKNLRDFLLEVSSKTFNLCE